MTLLWQCCLGGVAVVLLALAAAALIKFSAGRNRLWNVLAFLVFFVLCMLFAVFVAPVIWG